ncbi:hypothetical protein [Cryobacterium sp. Y57]|uniref:hypothetical protein n=1 Tax=Cryobacterium sp. Y57 TaxID=2048287 RepID=UPI000CE38580|nr:hypothetical protein [Cryobacterium sp. Y57]
MTDHTAEAERILTPLMPDEIRALQEDRSLQLIIIGANLRAQALATLALADATRAQTLVLERMERNRQTRTVGL